MLRFKLISEEENILNFEYYPEDESHNKGEIKIEKQTLKVISKKDAVSPFNLFVHALQGIINDDGTYNKEGMVAWY